MFESLYPITSFRRPLFPSMFDDRFFRAFTEPAPMQGIRVDVKESDKDYTLLAELPGVKPEDIRLSAENDVLTIEADINTERKEERDRYVFTERRSGHVSRCFSLEGVDQKNIRAAYENGLLRVTLPKQLPEPKTAARTIAIEGIKPAADTAQPVVTGEGAQA